MELRKIVPLIFILVFLVGIVSAHCSENGAPVRPVKKNGDVLQCGIGVNNNVAYHNFVLKGSCSAVKDYKNNKNAYRNVPGDGDDSYCICEEQYAVFEPFTGGSDSSRVCEPIGFDNDGDGLYVPHKDYVVPNGPGVLNNKYSALKIYYLPLPYDNDDDDDNDDNDDDDDDDNDGSDFPNVELLKPEQNEIVKGDVGFLFNVSPAESIQSCYLNVDSVVYEFLNISEQMSYNLSLVNGNYLAYAYCIDDENRTGVSDVVDFSVLTDNNESDNESDNMPPGRISNLVVENKSYNWIYWTWDNPNDEDFYHTMIYIDGVNIAVTSDEFYNATGLEEDTLYNISIKTVDVNGNVNDNPVSDSERTEKKDDDDDNDDDDNDEDDDDDNDEDDDDDDNDEDEDFSLSDRSNFIVRDRDINESRVLYLSDDSNEEEGGFSNYLLLNVLLVFLSFILLIIILLILIIGQRK